MCVCVLYSVANVSLALFIHSFISIFARRSFKGINRRVEVFGGRILLLNDAKHTLCVCVRACVYVCHDKAIHHKIPPTLWSSHKHAQIRGHPQIHSNRYVVAVACSSAI